MTKILATSMTNKKVVSADGDKLGDLKDMVSDFKTGQLTDLVVDPDMSVDKSRYREDEGFILLPFDSVKAIKEVVIVDGRKARSARQASEAPAGA